MQKLIGSGSNLYLAGTVQFRVTIVYSGPDCNIGTGLIHISFMSSRHGASIQTNRHQIPILKFLNRYIIRLEPLKRTTRAEHDRSQKINLYEALLFCITPTNEIALLIAHLHQARTPNMYCKSWNRNFTYMIDKLGIYQVSRTGELTGFFFSMWEINWLSSCVCNVAVHVLVQGTKGSG